MCRNRRPYGPREALAPGTTTEECMKSSFLPFLAAGVAVSGCATKKYVTREVGEVNPKVDNLTTEVEKTQERTKRNEVRIDEVDQHAAGGDHGGQGLRPAGPDQGRGGRAGRQGQAHLHRDPLQRQGDVPPEPGQGGRRSQVHGGRVVLCPSFLVQAGLFQRPARHLGYAPGTHLCPRHPAYAPAPSTLGTLGTGRLTSPQPS